MALAGEFVWGVSASFIDRDKNVATVRFALPSTLVYADAEAAALAVINAMTPLSDAVLTGFTLSQGQSDPLADYLDAPESSEVERKGVFEWKAANGGISRIEVPSIKGTLVIDGTDAINTTDALVTTFVTTFLNTGLGAANSPVSFYGSDYVALFGTPHKMLRARKRRTV